MQSDEIIKIEKILGYTFKNKDLLRIAFCHTSYANENNVPSNETLEFLGDGILNFAIADFLYDKELTDEGRMSVIRSKIVSRNPLAREVERLGLLSFLKLGSSFDTETGMSNKFISNLYEAIVAAIYKDSDLKTAKDFIRRTLLANLDFVKSRDYKTKLQELAQAKRRKVTYIDKDTEGQPPMFYSQVFINGILRGEGSGSTKKDAQQAAASKALVQISGKKINDVDKR